MNSKKNNTNNKNEGRLNVMNETTNIAMDIPQLERISKNPIKIGGNMIVLDRLENGFLKIYKPNTDGPTYVQHSSNGDYVYGATPIAEITISILLEEKAVLIQEICCEKGYEKLAKAMIDQVDHFVEFYDELDNMGIKDSIYQKWVKA